MAKKSKALIPLLIFLFLFTGVINAASTVEINQLIENSWDYDKRKVTIQGEAIGEVLERGEFAWININDGTNAIGVWLDLEEAKQIQYWGDYKHRGDIVKVTGMFNRDCMLHGGDIDVHNIKLEIVKKGYVLKEIVSPMKCLVSFILLSIMTVMIFFYYKIMKKPEIS